MKKEKLFRLVLVGLMLMFAITAVGPIQAQSKPSEPKTAAAKAPVYPDGTLLMSTDSKAVYVIEKGKKLLIPDPPTFNAKKYRWDQIMKVEPAVLKSIPAGKPLPSVIPQPKGKK
jgi:hypothetical protein